VPRSYVHACTSGTHLDARSAGKAKRAGEPLASQSKQVSACELRARQAGAPKQSCLALRARDNMDRLEDRRVPWVVVHVALALAHHLRSQCRWQSALRNTT